jgi:hypothetical protein
MLHLTPLILNILFGLLILCIGCIIFLAIRKKQISPIIICLVLLSIPFIFKPTPPEKPEPPTPEEQQLLIQEQMNFSEWYTAYKKDIDRLNNNWQQYHKIIKAFQNDTISVQTAHARLADLYTKSNLLNEKLTQLTPPANLTDDNHNHVLEIISKTKIFSRKQTKIIETSVYALDGQNLLNNIQHDDQVNTLQKILILADPINLDISQDLLPIQTNLMKAPE